jgi:hypothetical protein
MLARSCSPIFRAAPDYAISNQIGVRPSGAESQAKAVDSSLDSDEKWE